MKKFLALFLTVMMLIGTDVSAFGVSKESGQGSIWTTNGFGQTVDQNIYGSKQEVFLNGGPNGENGNGGFEPGSEFYVRVLSPNNKVLGQSTSVVKINSKGILPAVRLYDIVKTASSDFKLYGYDNTENSGGEYKVEIGTIVRGKFIKYKSDNFKVQEGATIVINKMVDNVRDDSTKFTVEITGPNEYKNTVLIQEGIPTVINGLPSGIYTITEQKYDGYSIVGHASYTVSLYRNLIYPILFINHKDPPPPTGSITIYKDVDNVTGDPVQFEFKITGPGSDPTVRTVNVKEGYPETVSGLPEGVYTITETPKAGYEIVGDGTKTVNIGEGIIFPWMKVVGFTNHKLPDKGTLTIQKDVVNSDGVDPTLFTITVTGPGTFSQTDTISETKTWTLNDLAPGTYTITEAQNSEYSTQTPNPLTVDIGLGDVSSWVKSITVVNLKMLPPPPTPKGTIYINKDVDNVDNDTNIFKVNVNGPDYDNQVFDLKEGTTIKLENLKPGNYEITELPYEGYTQQNPSQIVTIGPEGPESASAWIKSITFVNSKNPPPPTGSLTIIKDVDNVENDPTEFVFRITGPIMLSAVAVVPVVDMTVKVVEGTPKVIPDLPVGHYMVQESENPKYTVKSRNPQYVDVTAGGETQQSDQVTFVNSKNPLGTLTIFKNVDNVESDPHEFNVRIVGTIDKEIIYTNDNVKIKEGTPTIITDLKPGEYTITEDTDTDYTVESTNPVIVSIGYGEVPSWSETAGFVNRKIIPPSGSITISKDVNNITNDQTNFSFTITGPNYSNTLSIKEGSPQTVSNLPEGEYTITESVPGNYRIQSTNPVTVRIGSDDANPWNKEVSFVNSYYYEPPVNPVYGSITINKNVNNVDNDPTEFQVQIAGPVNTTAVIKEGTPTVINNLPQGIYTVSELANGQYTIVSTNPVSVSVNLNTLNPSVTFENQKTAVVPPEEVPGAPVSPTPVPEEPVPGGSAKLPNTGELPPSLFYIIGAAIVSMGTILKRK